MKAVTVASTLGFFIYVQVGIISIYMFGYSLYDDVIENIDKENNNFSIFVRLAFMIMLSCIIPFEFFPAKEALLIIFDESRNGSMQLMLTEKIHRSSNQVMGGESIEKDNRDQEQDLPYLSMPNRKYYTITVILYLICIGVPLFVSDLGVLFELISAFGLAVICYAMPGIFYLLLISSPNSNRHIEGKCQRILNVIGSITMIMVCIINMGLVVYKMFA